LTRVECQISLDKINFVILINELEIAYCSFCQFRTHFMVENTIVHVRLRPADENHSPGGLFLSPDLRSATALPGCMSRIKNRMNALARAAVL
jgi:hypothetical protein